MKNLATSVVFVFGAAIALAGIAIDYLLPGTSPGINLPQILIIAAGLVLSIAAVLARRGKTRYLPSSTFGKTFVSIVVVTMATLLALELLLSVWGMPTYFPSQLPEAQVTVTRSGVCDKRGCRFKYDETKASCAAGELSGRNCKVNRQGYADDDDFVVGADFDGRTRILTLGDSFTLGLSADVGSSFVETVEAAFPDAILWNVAITNTGTIHDLAAFNEYAPILKPQLTILGFYMNDFRDNLRQVETGIQLRDSEGNIRSGQYLQYDRWGNLFELPRKVAFAYASHGARPPTTELERAVGSTRLGTLLLRFMDIISTFVVDASFGQQVQLARQYLTQLRDGAFALDSHLLVVLVPQRSDIGAPGNIYKRAIELMEDLGIPYLDPVETLTEQDYAPVPDIHWNNAGHQKIGAILSECVAAFRLTNELGGCEDVVISPRR